MNKNIVMGGVAVVVVATGFANSGFSKAPDDQSKINNVQLDSVYETEIGSISIDKLGRPILGEEPLMSAINKDHLSSSEKLSFLDSCPTINATAGCGAKSSKPKVG